MKVNLFNENFYKNRYLLKGLEFAANNGALFVAGTTLTLSTIIRPLSIWATPKTDKENKKLALVKSLASSAGGYLLIMAASIPMARNVKKIDKNPIKYLTPQAIASLGNGEQKITDSKNYQFATQLFKLGLGIAMAVPKSVFTNLLISPFLTLNNKMKHKTDNNINSSAHAVFAKKDDNTSFKGKGSPANREPFTKFIAGVLNLPCIQKFAERFKDSNFAMHIMAITDTLSTLTLVGLINKNKHLDKDRKRVLNYNSILATGLSLACSYTADASLDGVTEKFIKRFKEINKDAPKLGKYVEGIKIAKPTFILGITYYALIPLLSTFLAERIDNISHHKSVDKTI